MTSGYGEMAAASSLLLQELRAEKPALLWIVMYSPATERGTRGDKRAIKVQLALAEEQHRLGGVVVLEAVFQPSALHHEAVQEFIVSRGWGKQHVHWCELKASVFNKPIRATTVLHCNKWLISEIPRSCKCGNAPEEHVPRIQGCNAASLGRKGTHE